MKAFPLCAAPLIATFAGPGVASAAPDKLGSTVSTRFDATFDGQTVNDDLVGELAQATAARRVSDWRTCGDDCVEFIVGDDVTASFIRLTTTACERLHWERDEEACFGDYVWELRIDISIDTASDDSGPARQVQLHGYGNTSYQCPGRRGVMGPGTTLTQLWGVLGATAQPEVEVAAVPGLAGKGRQTAEPIRAPWFVYYGLSGSDADEGYPQQLVQTSGGAYYYDYPMSMQGSVTDDDWLRCSEAADAMREATDVAFEAFEQTVSDGEIAPGAAVRLTRDCEFVQSTHSLSHQTVAAAVRWIGEVVDPGERMASAFEQDCP